MPMSEQLYKFMGIPFGKAEEKVIQGMYSKDKESPKGYYSVSRSSSFDGNTWRYQMSKKVGLFICATFLILKVFVVTSKCLLGHQSGWTCLWRIHGIRGLQNDVPSGPWEGCSKDSIQGWPWSQEDHQCLGKDQEEANGSHVIVGLHNTKSTEVRCRKCSCIILFSMFKSLTGFISRRI